MLEQRGSLAPGTVVGRYEIVSFLGAGGMGQVYVARDSTLDRPVALKILATDCSAERVQRFQREARAASALNHPSIVAVHDAGTVDDVRFLAMELVDGRPLSAWIRGRRERRRGILLMAQVADGLARAHAAGIVHRDIKPDNILVAENYAKIADFGIAKLTTTDSDAAAATDVKTADGEMVGTLAYMSPEQIEGPDVDFRSDVFSFGVVLYEVLTGQSPFRRSTRAETVHAIVHQSPSLEPVPTALRKIVARCLAKDREDRYHSMKDVAHDVREAAAVEPVRTRTLRWVWVALAAVALAGAGWYLARRTGSSGTPPAMTATRLTNSGQIRATTISPDGKFIAYVARERGLESVWVKQVATGMSTLIAAPSSNRYYKMAISPDSNYVYVSMQSPAEFDTNVLQIPILGGDGRNVLRFHGSSEFALAPDGHRIVVRQMKPQTFESQIAVSDIDGGPLRVLLTRPLSSTTYLPAWSPDGKSIAFGTTTFAPVLTRRLETIEVATGKTSTIRTIDWPYVASISWSPDGRKLIAAAYENEQPPQIWSIPLDGSPPSKITNDVSGYYAVALTADGKSLAALRGEGAASLTLLEVQPDGRALPVVRGLGNYFVLAGARVLSSIPTHLLSGGGVAWLGNDRLLYTGVTDGLRTILVIPAAGGEPRAVMRGMAAWHPVADEQRGRILFLSDRSGNAQVWSCAIDGSSPQQLTSGDQVFAFAAGRDSIYYANGGSEHAGLRRIPITGGTPETIAPRFVMPLSISKDARLLIARGLNGITASAVNGSNMKTFAIPRFGPPVASLDPTGRSITFVDWKDDIANLWSQDLSGGEPRQITNFDRGEIYSFAWSPDGKRIAVSQGEPSTDVVLMRNVIY